MPSTAAPRAALLLLCLCPFAAASAAGVAHAAFGTRSFGAVADASVQKGHPRRHLGAQRWLRLSGHPTERSYLRFNLRGVAESVASAELRLFVRRGQGPFTVRALSGHGWRERRINFRTAPGATLPGRVTGRARPGRWVTADVSRFAKAGGMLDLVLSSRGRQIEFASRESARVSPRLVLTVVGLGAIGPLLAPAPPSVPAPAPSPGGSPPPDSTPPDTSIGSGPSGVVGSAAASFDLISSESGSTFECSLDRGAWEACSSPKSYTGLADGPHELWVRAIDGAGNVDASPASRSWTVDVTAPETSLESSGPSGSTNSTTASFGFSSNDTGANFECQLEGGAWDDCVSPRSYANLADGSHAFSVRAIDGAGNADATPSTRMWTVDTVPPSVSITSPTAGTRYTTAQNIQITATASTDTARVDYFDNGSLAGAEDALPFAFSWTVSSADNGAHSWTARATDEAGNVGTGSAPVAVTVDIPLGDGSGDGAAITPSAETAPVPHGGDAADDAAVWIHPDDPSKSTIVGTDKLGGLAVYDLAGNQLFYYADSRPNNVDVRYNFPLDGDRVGLVATSDNSSTKALRVYTVDPSTRGLRYAAARTINTGVAAGLCMYHSKATGDYYAFLSDNSGTIQQWRLFDAGGGKVDATKVRTITLGSTTEGCVADDETGDLYISQEDVALWKYGAEPGDGTGSADRTKVDGLVSDGGHLTSDIEGLAIYYRNGGAGYLIASSQGSNDYVVFDRGGTNPFVTRFSVVDGTIDGSSYTDGVDVTNFPTAAGFSNGLFVAQDNTNTLPSANQDFKLVPWERIADANGLSIDTSWDPRLVGDPVTYYLDATDGDDSNAGTSPSHPWRTLAKATAAQLQPGERLLLKRGEAWTGKLALSQSGIAGKAIVIGSYGTGPLPKIQQGSDCVGLTGSYMTVKELQVDNCGFAGFSIAGDSNTVRDSLMTGSVAGAYVKASASGTRVLDSELRDNNKMSVNTPAPGDDSGAFGVLLHGSQSEIAGNLISGSDALSYDYGRDGAAIEVYGGSSNHLHHNLAVDNDTFSELGEAGSADNTFAYNVVRSSLTDSRFLVTRGGAGSRGPVLRTALYNNTVLFTGSTSQGVVCHEGCTNDVLRMRNNIIQAVAKVGYADGPLDEDYDLFWGGAVQFSPGPNSQVADPRFVDPAGWDLGLQALSPAVDSGEAVPGYDHDQAGASVPYDGDGDGSPLTDRGAFEYHP